MAAAMRGKEKFSDGKEKISGEVQGHRYAQICEGMVENGPEAHSNGIDKLG